MCNSSFVSGALSNSTLPPDSCCLILHCSRQMLSNSTLSHIINVFLFSVSDILSNSPLLQTVNAQLPTVPNSCLAFPCFWYFIQHPTVPESCLACPCFPWYFIQLPTVPDSYSLTLHRFRYLIQFFPTPNSCCLTFARVAQLSEGR